MSALVVFARGSQKNRTDLPPPVPLTWDYAVRLRKEGGYWACQSELDMALCTCASGHTTRLSGRVHTIAADGTVLPSYVCPVGGCSFHEMVRLDGWDPAHVFEVVDIESASD